MIGTDPNLNLPTLSDPLSTIVSKIVTGVYADLAAKINELRSKIGVTFGFVA